MSGPKPVVLIVLLCAFGALNCGTLRQIRVDSRYDQYQPPPDRRNHINQVAQGLDRDDPRLFSSAVVQLCAMRIGNGPRTELRYQFSSGSGHYAERRARALRFWGQLTPEARKCIGQTIVNTRISSRYPRPRYNRYRRRNRYRRPRYGLTGDRLVRFQIVALVVADKTFSMQLRQTAARKIYLADPGRSVAVLKRHPTLIPSEFADEIGLFDTDPKVIERSINLLHQKRPRRLSRLENLVRRRRDIRLALARAAGRVGIATLTAIAPDLLKLQRNRRWREMHPFWGALLKRNVVGIDRGAVSKHYMRTGMPVKRPVLIAIIADAKLDIELRNRAAGLYFLRRSGTFPTALKPFVGQGVLPLRQELQYLMTTSDTAERNKTISRSIAAVGVYADFVKTVAWIKTNHPGLIRTLKGDAPRLISIVADIAEYDQLVLTHARVQVVAYNQHLGHVTPVRPPSPNPHQNSYYPNVQPPQPTPQPNPDPGETRRLRDRIRGPLMPVASQLRRLSRRIKTNIKRLRDATTRQKLRGWFVVKNFQTALVLRSEVFPKK